jgi:hypothetical protein
MHKIFFLSLFYISLQLISCAQSPKTRWVDDIVPDAKLDGSFTICNTEEEAIQYFNDGKGFEYIGGKYALDSIFFSKYKQVDLPSATGLIRIRFMVNCRGESGRFRLIGMDPDYQEKNFERGITEQLLTITKSLNGWPPKQWKNTSVDYYQYLIFKLEGGKLIKILP